MNYKSRAISLHYIKYGESSIIAKIFTEEIGLQSFVIRGVRTRRSKKKLSLFQPLQLILIEGSYIAKKNLQFLNDVNTYNYKTDSKIYMKNTFLWMFMSDVLLKTLRENEADKGLFLFIWNLKKSTSQNKNLNANTELLFLINLTKYLGFYPLKNLNNGLYFDLELGHFTKWQPKKNYINAENTCYFKELINNNDTLIPLKNKQELLLNIFKYYELHHHKLKNISSHKILHSII